MPGASAEMGAASGNRYGSGIVSTFDRRALCPPGGAGISGSAQPVDTPDAASTTSTAGGAGTDGTVIELGPEDVVLTAGLVRFDDCDTLLDYLHEEYSARVGPWGFDRGGWFGPMRRAGGDDMAMADEAMAVEAESAAAAPTTATSATVAQIEGVDFSGTNVQEAGVDEADIVKTDGTRIFTLSAGRLVVVDAASRSRLGEVVVAEGWGRELFIDGDGLLLITRSTSDAPDRSETAIQRAATTGRPRHAFTPTTCRPWSAWPPWSCSPRRQPDRPR